MVTFLLLLALLSPQIPHESELKDAVSAYWNLMTKGEKAAAMKFVLPNCQNDFVNRGEPKIRTWRLLSVKPVSDTEAVVAVQMEALFKQAALSAGFQSVEKRETWVWDQNSWKLKVAKPSIDAIAPLFSSTTDRPLPKALQITPSVLRIQFFSNAQVGRLHIKNGLPQAAELVSVRFDETRFDLVERPSLVEAGKTADLALRYKGTETDKNLESQVTLVLKQEGQEKLYQVPVRYNYFSDGARALFGLTEEQARNVKRGDKLRPVVKQPETGKQTPTPLAPPAKRP
ncbi:MAG: hypothetical protein EHM23_29765 [Acidobacteria bacterium]|nr:MAG: hypothetical protein EHM23_29765 [Acidobacteriota bacterium]